MNVSVSPDLSSTNLMIYPLSGKKVYVTCTIFEGDSRDILFSSGILPDNDNIALKI